MGLGHHVAHKPARHLVNTYFGTPARTAEGIGEEQRYVVPVVGISYWAISEYNSGQTHTEARENFGTKDPDSARKNSKRRVKPRNGINRLEGASVSRGSS